MAFQQVAGQPYYFDSTSGQYGVPQISYGRQTQSTLDAFGLPQPSGPVSNTVIPFGTPDAAKGEGFGLTTNAGWGDMNPGLQSSQYPTWGTLGAVPQGFDTSSVLSGYANQPGAQVTGFYTGANAPQVIGAGAGPVKDGGLLSQLQGLAIPGAWLAAGGLAGLAGAGAGTGGITADSIGAGMIGGENAAGAMYGASAGATGAGSMDFSNLFGDMTGGENATDAMYGASGMPPTLPDVPTNWGMPTGSGSGDWWSQYGLSSDPTAASGGAGSSILNQIGSTLKSAGMSPGSLAQVLGKLGAAGLGALGSNIQQNSLNNLSQQYIGFGAPSRARYEASMTPGFDPNSIPGYAGAVDTASKSVLARLSATGGNPFGNPGGLIDANKQIIAGTALPAIQTYQGQNANTGFGASMNAAVPLQTAAIGQQGNVLNSLGYGLNAVTNPQPTLADQIRALQLGGFA